MKIRGIILSMAFSLNLYAVDVSNVVTPEKYCATVSGCEVLNISSVTDQIVDVKYCNTGQFRVLSMYSAPTNSGYRVQNSVCPGYYCTCPGGGVAPIFSATNVSGQSCYGSYNPWSCSAL